jgi:hypothetical protein
LLGWIYPSREYIASSAQDQRIFIERLENPGSNGFLDALISIDNSNTQFYSVEFRKFVGLDKNEISCSGILIHRINLTGPVDLNVSPAKVVDKTFDFNPNDAGAVWTPGETFSDGQNHISCKSTKRNNGRFLDSIQSLHRLWKS